jgi:hypothetical protein
LYLIPFSPILRIKVTTIYIHGTGREGTLFLSLDGQGPGVSSPKTCGLYANFAPRDVSLHRGVLWEVYGKIGIMNERLRRNIRTVLAEDHDLFRIVRTIQRMVGGERLIGDGSIGNYTPYGNRAKEGYAIHCRIGIPGT